MISAFEVYAVMQLDSVALVVFVISVLATIAVAVTAVIVAIERDYCSEGSDRHTLLVGMHKAVLRFALWLLLPYSIVALLPSSKTAAAMIVLPAVTSDAAMEMVKPEFRELLDLTKDALRGLAAPKNQDAKDGGKVENES